MAKLLRSLSILLISFHIIYETSYGKKLNRKCRKKREDPSTEEFQPRIAGGRSVHPGDTPYHLQLRYLDKYHSGAALVISNDGFQIVVTGAQCVTKKKGSDLLDTDKFSVVGGRVKIDGAHYYEQFRKVKKLIRHPKWHRTWSLDYNDLAILHIDEPFEITRLVQPIPLTPKEEKATGTVVISGWGYTSPNSNALSEYLQVSKLEVVDLKKCQETYNWEITASVQKEHFCAGKYDSPDHKGACLGDTGGPAVSVHNFTLYLVGIFDYGLPKCGNRFQPSVFTDLSYYLKWINEQSKPVKRSVETPKLDKSLLFKTWA